MQGYHPRRSLLLLALVVCVLAWAGVVTSQTCGIDKFDFQGQCYPCSECKGTCEEVQQTVMCVCDPLQMGNFCEEPKPLRASQNGKACLFSRDTFVHTSGTLDQFDLTFTPTDSWPTAYWSPDLFRHFHVPGVRRSSVHLEARTQYGQQFTSVYFGFVTKSNNFYGFTVAYYGEYSYFARGKYTQNGLENLANESAYATGFSHPLISFEISLDLDTGILSSPHCTGCGILLEQFGEDDEIIGILVTRTEPQEQYTLQMLDFCIHATDCTNIVTDCMKDFVSFMNCEEFCPNDCTGEGYDANSACGTCTCDDLNYNEYYCDNAPLVNLFFSPLSNFLCADVDDICIYQFEQPSRALLTKSNRHLGFILNNHRDFKIMSYQTELDIPSLKDVFLHPNYTQVDLFIGSDLGAAFFEEPKISVSYEYIRMEDIIQNFDIRSNQQIILLSNDNMPNVNVTYTGSIQVSQEDFPLRINLWDYGSWLGGYLKIFIQKKDEQVYFKQFSLPEYEQGYDIEFSEDFQFNSNNCWDWAACSSNVNGKAMIDGGVESVSCNADYPFVCADVTELLEPTVCSYLFASVAARETCESCLASPSNCYVNYLEICCGKCHFEEVSQLMFLFPEIEPCIADHKCFLETDGKTCSVYPECNEYEPKICQPANPFLYCGFTECSEGCGTKSVCRPKSLLTTRAAGGRFGYEEVGMCPEVNDKTLCELAGCELVEICAEFPCQELSKSQCIASQYCIWPQEDCFTEDCRSIPYPECMEYSYCVESPYETCYNDNARYEPNPDPCPFGRDSYACANWHYCTNPQSPDCLRIIREFCCYEGVWEGIAACDWVSAQDCAEVASCAPFPVCDGVFPDDELHNGIFTSYDSYIQLQVIDGALKVKGDFLSFNLKNVELTIQYCTQSLFSYFPNKDHILVTVNNYKGIQFTGFAYFRQNEVEFSFNYLDNPCGVPSSMLSFFRVYEPEKCDIPTNVCDAVEGCSVQPEYQCVPKKFDWNSGCPYQCSSSSSNNGMQEFPEFCSQSPFCLLNNLGMSLNPLNTVCDGLSFEDCVKVRDHGDRICTFANACNRDCSTHNARTSCNADEFCKWVAVDECVVTDCGAIDDTSSCEAVSGCAPQIPEGKCIPIGSRFNVTNECPFLFSGTHCAQYHACNSPTSQECIDLKTSYCCQIGWLFEDPVCSGVPASNICTIECPQAPKYIESECPTEMLNALWYPVGFGLKRDNFIDDEISNHYRWFQDAIFYASSDRTIKIYSNKNGKEYVHQGTFKCAEHDVGVQIELSFFSGEIVINGIFAEDETYSQLFLGFTTPYSCQIGTLLETLTNEQSGYYSYYLNQVFMVPLAHCPEKTPRELCNDLPECYYNHQGVGYYEGCWDNTFHEQGIFEECPYPHTKDYCPNNYDYYCRKVSGGCVTRNCTTAVDYCEDHHGCQFNSGSCEPDSNVFATPCPFKRGCSIWTYCDPLLDTYDEVICLSGLMEPCCNSDIGYRPEICSMLGSPTCATIFGCEMEDDAYTQSACSDAPIHLPGVYESTSGHVMVRDDFTGEMSVILYQSSRRVENSFPFVLTCWETAHSGFYINLEFSDGYKARGVLNADIQNTELKIVSADNCTQHDNYKKYEKIDFSLPTPSLSCNDTNDENIVLPTSYTVHSTIHLSPTISIFSNCTQGEIIYEWKYLENPPLLQHLNLHLPSLTIPKATLHPGPNNVELTVTMGKYMKTLIFYFNIDRVPPQPVVTPQLVSASHYYRDQLIFDACSSYSVEPFLIDGTKDSSELSYNWYCGGLCDVTYTEVPCIYNVTFPSAPADYTSTIQLTVANHYDTAVRQATLYISMQPIGHVSLDVPNARYRNGDIVVNHDQYVRIVGEYNFPNTNPASLTFEWTCIRERTHDDCPPMIRENFATSFNQANLVIRPNVLTNPEKSYVFQLKVTSPNVSGKATVRFAVNRSPDSGFLYVSPTTYNFRDAITLQAVLFSDPEGDGLFYNFGYRLSSTAKYQYVWTNSRTQDHVVISSLPPGKIEVIAFVSDSYGAKARTNLITLTILHPQFSSPTERLMAANDVLDNEIERARRENDANSLLTAIITCASILDTDFNEEDSLEATSLRTLLIEAVGAAANLTYLEDETVVSLLQALEYVTAKPEQLDITDLDSLLALLEDWLNDSRSGASSFVGVLSSIIAAYKLTSATGETSQQTRISGNLLNLLNLVLEDSICGEDALLLSSGDLEALGQRAVDLRDTSLHFNDGTEIAFGNGDFSIEFCVELRSYVQSNIPYEDKAEDPLVLGIISSMLTIEIYQNSGLLDNLDSEGLVRFTIPFENYTELQVNETIGCVFYDHNLSTWSNEGCSVEELTKTYVTCVCNHLTEFSVGVLKLQLNAPDLSYNAHLYNLLRTTGGIATLVTVIGLFCVFLLLLMFTVVYDNRDKATEVVPSFKEIQDFVENFVVMYEKKCPAIILKTRCLFEWRKAYKIDPDTTAAKVSFKEKMKVLFYVGFRSDHLWASLFFRPLNNYRRTERLFVAFTILYLSLCVNAFFYRYWGDTYTLERLLNSILNGLITSLIVFVPTTIIGFCFRRIGDRPVSTKEESIQMEEIDSNVPGETMGKQQKKLLQRLYFDISLPWWMTYIVYFVVLALDAFCIYFTLLFGVYFNSATAIAWIVSFFISLLISVFVLQPLKAMLGAIFSALAVGFAAVPIVVASIWTSLTGSA